MEDKSDKINRCLRNPMLVYESTSQDLPINLTLLLSTFNECELTQNDRLVILAYTLMVETGFLPAHAANDFERVKRSPTFDIDYLKSTKTIQSNWKNADGVYTLQFVLPSLPEHTLCLTAQPTGRIVVFTVWLKDNEGSPSWCIALDCDKYVMRTQTEFMTHRYVNLKDLSQHFKNKIPLPARHFLKVYGSVAVSGLLELPEEIQVMVVSYLNHIHDVMNLSKTCVALYEICRPKILTSRRLRLLPNLVPHQFTNFNETIGHFH